MKYLDLFTGIGGFTLGIGNKGECVGYSEIDKYASQVYYKHFPNHKNYGDITTINADRLPDSEGLFMFMPKTFNAYCEGDIKSDIDQVKCFNNLYKSHPEWWECK